MTVAWLYPGQGSQYVGMAKAWASASAAAADAISEASDVLGFDVGDLMFEGPAADLADTYNQQPAVLAASVAITRAISGELPSPAMVAGHSLGEYSALVAANALSYADALRLVRERGRLMGLAGTQNPGSMAAVLGLDDQTVRLACEGVPGAQVANYNAPGQVVISGERDAIARVTAELQSLGAKRVVALPITIAAHSELMRSVVDAFAKAVGEARIGDCTVPLIANVSARAITDASEVRDELSRQLTASVQWTDSVRAMFRAGVRELYELGPGDVLTGLVRRIARTDGIEDVSVQSKGEPQG